jgi:hypothetical protein
MANDQLRAALADVQVHPPAELALQFDAKLREIRHSAGGRRDAPAEPTLGVSPAQRTGIQCIEMTNDQLCVALADGQVHTVADLAPQFGVSFREIRRRVYELRDAPAGPVIEEVWTYAGLGYRLARDRVLSERPVAQPTTSPVA